jgi:hypothetical protein
MYSVLFCAFLLAPPDEVDSEHRSEAARPQRGGGFDEGGYIYLTPGSFVLPHLRFGWGFGAGYMFSRGKLFKATLGAVFEHTVLAVFSINHHFGAQVIRFMPETRIGLGSNKVWGYGLFGVGITGLFTEYFGAGLNYWPRERDSAAGVNVQLGGGVQGIVYRNLFLGGEVDFDVGRVLDHDSSTVMNDWTVINQVAFEFMIGWYF